MARSVASVVLPVEDSTAQKSQPFAGPFLTALAAADGVGYLAPSYSIRPPSTILALAGQAPLVETSGTPSAMSPAAMICSTVMP